jgi:hypothetical protein
VTARRGVLPTFLDEETEVYEAFHGGPLLHVGATGIEDVYFNNFWNYISVNYTEKHKQSHNSVRRNFAFTAKSANFCKDSVIKINELLP